MKYLGVTTRILIDKFERINLTSTYLDLIKDSSFIPLLLPPNLEAEKLNQMLKLCDRFLITGGIDVHPKYFQQELNRHTDYDSRLDDLDFSVLKYAVEHNLPVLGICRGLQVINVHFGGDLNQHLDSKSLLAHYDGTHYLKAINQEKKSLNLDKQEYLVNSYHHQAIKKLGDGLTATFLSDDNLIEGVIHKSLPIIAVQWHIEQDINSELTSKIWYYFESM